MHFQTAQNSKIEFAKLVSYLVTHTLTVVPVTL